jgi:GNAT superfamily N-acetyltransferase
MNDGPHERMVQMNDGPSERRMSDGPQFRLAGGSDANTLLEFMRSYYAFDGHGFDREKARVALTALLRDPSLSLAWLILDRGTAVGFVVLGFGDSLECLGRNAFVDQFYLREEYRGRGWGRQTMAFLEDAARLEGIRRTHPSRWAAPGTEPAEAAPKTLGGTADICYSFRGF